MQRVKLYIDIDGVLLTKKQTKPAEYSTEFINYIVDNFDCFWLTTHCKGNNENAIKYLSQYFSEPIVGQLKSIKSTYWKTLKTEAIDFNADFLWLEDNPFVSEIKILEESKLVEKLLIVNLENNDELKRVLQILESKR